MKYIEVNISCSKDGGKNIKATTEGDLLVIAAFIVSVSAMAITYGGENNWIAHAITGMVALALVTEIDVAGAVMARRLKGPKVKDIFVLHRHASAQLVAFTVMTFSFGLWIRFQHGDPLLATPHGWLGAVTVALVILQWGSCYFKKRRGIKLFHMTLGYLLPALVVAQSVMGFLLTVTKPT